MPIEKMFKARYISEEEFREIDFQTMGFTFAIQNEIGRFWNEKIYPNELAYYRCQKAGFDNVETEMPIKVSFKDFEKSYYIDLLINDSIFEAEKKTSFKK